ncbi:hypothetical protein WICPIJ_007163 [Wickerhamomyces pijperi]|uniref:precorrin-2 dehydrogenase n=1 Tax=Wickerhamomyces pijperi TaxID=599730 RepID=A0A9P8Q0B4_WICPI|nr:hypothetical protein WICPIJ_007163 [Wickerhamomyces pijperi]
MKRLTSFEQDRHVLVVGGGEVAAGRIYHLLNANAKITVIAPTINEEIQYRQTHGQLHAVHLREFQESDLQMYHNGQEPPKLEHFTEEEYKQMDQYLLDSKFELVLVAIDDPIESKKIYYLSKQLGLNVNIADVPPLCDFYFGAIFRKGPLQVMISTNGKGPRMARLVKDKIGDMFKDVEIDTAIENINNVRQLIRSTKLQGTDNDTIAERMRWMIKITDWYSIKQWSDFKDGFIEKVVESYPGTPPNFESL